MSILLLACMPSVLLGQLIPSAKATQVADGKTITLSFKAEPKCQNQLVRLGDLVEITSGDRVNQDDLKDMPLSPAPAVGAFQEWTSADVLRHMELRGISSKSVRWSGSERVQLTRAVATPPRAKPMGTPAFVQDRTVEQAVAAVSQATREYLWLQTGERTDWRISTKVPYDHAQALSMRRSITSISGIQEPWVGEHRVVLTYKAQGKENQVELSVRVDLPPTVVVTTRPMRRDEVIDESALTYSPLPERMSDQEVDYFTDVRELIGKQLRRSMTTGQQIPRSAVGEPIVVSSNETVEIESSVGAVSVKTAARALSGGAVGDLITVEILGSRKRVTATVVGPLQVRISGASQAASPETSDSASALDPRLQQFKSPGADAAGNKVPPPASSRELAKGFAN